MLPIFIVEDVLPQREHIEEAINDYITSESMDKDVGIVMATANPYDCINYLEKNPNIKGLYFLDVDLKTDMDGLVLGKRIRELDPNGRIVIVTAKGSMAFFTFLYNLEVLDYIVKESADEVISRIKACVKVAFDRFLQLEADEVKELEIVVGSRRRKVPFKELCFLETCSEEHHLALHTTTGRMEFRGCMKEFEVKNPSLVRVHRTCLVNLDNARTFDGKNRVLEMVNGDLCHVSVRKVNIVKEAFDHKQKLHKPISFENAYYARA
jgi:two-component system response regulator AgrA